MLDGIQACYDHNFIRDGNALAPLMNVFHAKKIGPEIIREAIMAVSDFCDPPKADGETKYSANGLLLINKKSSSFKGLQRISNLLQHADPSIVQKLTMLITCTGKINNKQYLVVDPEIVCWEGVHLQIASVFGLVGLIMYVIGLPLLGLYILKNADRSTPSAQLRYGILYDGYSKKFWYWEITVVLRKLAIILIGEFY